MSGIGNLEDKCFIDPTTYPWAKIPSRIFGSRPWTIPDIDFFDGDSYTGMIVFKTPGTYSLTTYEPFEIELLIVAGGGGGGCGTTHANYNGGGGGAGGLLYGTTSISKATYTITVGAGGAGSSSTSSVGNSGGNSVVGGMVAIGGGGGGSSSNTDGADGGSGGGGAEGSGSGYAGSALQGSFSESLIGYGNDGEDVHDLNAGVGGGAGGGMSGMSIWGTTYATGGSKGSNAGDPPISPLYIGDGGGGRQKSLADPGRDGSGGIIIIRWGGYNKLYDPQIDGVG